jgi:alpha-N-arabinofuranosidase
MKIPFFLPLGLLAFNCYADGPSFTIDATHSAGEVSPRLYGLMTEEINHSYDGGLYAELVQNRAFLDSAAQPVHWSVVNSGESAATMALDPSNPLNESLTNSLRLTVTKADGNNVAGVANDGYWGIPATPNTTYHAEIFAKAGDGFAGRVRVAIVSADGKEVYAAKEFSGVATGWQKFQVKLKTGDMVPNANARLAITLDQPGTLWLGFVSLFPPTWNNQPNGFRKDLMQMLVDLHPKFLRMPGGNYVEGDTVDTRFDWKKTIGPVEERHGHPCPWGYRSSDGLGLLEYLKWCEDMKAEPVLAVYAGYSLKGKHVNPGHDLEPFVEDALDEIEYVTGDANTTWGARRAQDGHPAPFKLNYVEIGNEDWFDKSGSYPARFAQFHKAIKAKYPALKTISTVGDDQPTNTWITNPRPDVMDGHYYRPYREFLQMSPNYARDYDRNGPEIFVGEWAAYETPFQPWNERSHGEPPTPRFESAIGDAAFMAALERNSDLIKMQCYAPLFVNVNPGARQWRPNLIGYNNLSAYGSPSYYAIQMFSCNVGDEILATASTGSPVQGSATRDSRTGEIFIKLVNPDTNSVPLNIDINGVSALASKSTVISLSGKADDTNSIDDPRKIVPVTQSVRGLKPSFTLTLPPNSIVVLKVKAR